MSEAIHVAEIFGENVFDDAVMRERLPKSVYKKLKQTIEDGSELDPSIADVVAHAMKDWAVDNGATHYTHWWSATRGIRASSSAPAGLTGWRPRERSCGPAPACCFQEPPAWP